MPVVGNTQSVSCCQRVEHQKSVEVIVRLNSPLGLGDFTCGCVRLTNDWGCADTWKIAPMVVNIFPNLLVGKEGIKVCSWNSVS